jgi:hypothetical protein
MELGELINPQPMDLENHDDCYFCKAKNKLSTEVNDLTDSPDEDAAEAGDSLGEYVFKNDSGELGKALGGKPDSKYVVLKGLTHEASVAAHHLIPGNAALKESKSLMKFLWKDGSAVGNIGYNVNSRDNGVWLPGNYGVRPWGTHGKAFEANAKGASAEDFAFASIDEWRCQFHDAHKDYSGVVKGMLDKLADKLRANEAIWCPEQKKKNEDEQSQLFEIVARLNTLSARMKRMLVFPTTGWFNNVYTSRLSLEYMKKVENHQLTQALEVNR